MTITMKRVLFAIALCVAATPSFAQKKAVNEAQSIAKGTNANYDEARGLVKGALENTETKEDPKTWYVAGYVEDQQFSAERMKQVLGQQPNEPVMYTALMNILPYFEKAYELDQLPNEKGKVKPKYTKDLKGILGANHVYYVNAGAYYFDEKDYQKAYNAFEQYIKIANMPMFKGEKTAERDSQFMTVQYYSAIAATQLDNPQLAISTLNRAKDTEFKQNEVYQYLAYEYEQLQDSVNLEKILSEGFAKFPEEKYFLMYLINIYIYSDRNEQALQYLETAIQQEPNNAQLYTVRGRVYESGLKDMAKAEESFKKALEVDPNSTEALSSSGRVYYNQGVNKLQEANMINDAKLYQEEAEKAKGFFKQALPYFEKVHQADPQDKEAMTALRSIYYNLNMNAEFDAMDAKMNAN